MLFLCQRWPIYQTIALLHIYHSRIDCAFFLLSRKIIWRQIDEILLTHQHTIDIMPQILFKLVLYHKGRRKLMISLNISHTYIDSHKTLPIFMHLLYTRYPGPVFTRFRAIVWYILEEEFFVPTQTLILAVIPVWKSTSVWMIQCIRMSPLNFLDDQ